MVKKVRLLYVDVDNITFDELVDSFQEGLLLTLHVDMIMKLQKDREFYELLPNFAPSLSAAAVQGSPTSPRGTSTSCRSSRTRPAHDQGSALSAGHIEMEKD